jgi:hypothetical protein
MQPLAPQPPPGGEYLSTAAETVQGRETSSSKGVLGFFPQLEKRPFTRRKGSCKAGEWAGEAGES